MTGSGHLEAHLPATLDAAPPAFVARPALEVALSTALADAGGALLVGEAGMGKTRLAEHVLGDRRVVSVSCAELRHVGARDVVAGLLRDVTPEAGDLVSLLRGGTSAAGEPADEVLLLRAAGHRLASQIPPVSVFVDDAELLDAEQTKALVETVTASERPWVFASRRRLPGLAFPAVDVPALAPVEARELIDVLLPGASAELRALVLERAGDSPLFIQQCTRLMLENGAVRVSAGGTLVVELSRVSEIPRSMRAYVDERLDLLDPDEAHVLGVAATLGPHAEQALLEFLVADRRHAVAALVERGLLRPSTDVNGQPSVRLSHALFREAAEQRLSITQRIQTHRAAAEWYAVLPISQVLESQAFHLEQAVRLETPDCELLQRTVGAMVLYARSIEEERVQVSHQVLMRARELCDSRPECDVDDLQLVLALASVTHTAGLEDEAIASATRALALAEERSEIRAVGEAHLQLGRALAAADPQQALVHLDQAETAYDEVEDKGGIGRVEVTRAFTRQYSEGTAQQLASLERAYNLGIRSADTRLQAGCAQQLALHHAIANGRKAFEVWAGRARDMSRRDDLGLEPRLRLSEAILASFELNPVMGRDIALQAKTQGRELGLRDVLVNAQVASIDHAVVAGDLVGAVEELAEARDIAQRRPSPWAGLQLDLLEARVLARDGDPVGAQALLQQVADHQLAENRVMRRDLAEARAWIAMERGSFREARALAQEAIGIDQETGEICSQLRPRLVELVSTVAVNDNVALGTIAELKKMSRDTGLLAIIQLALRWLYVEELTQGWDVDLHSLEQSELIECRALDLEIEALQYRRYRKLLEAAEVWGELGVTVWKARALLWYSELTGLPARGAADILAALQTPQGVEKELRSQVAPLKR